jgi:hypothetical protein
MELAQPPHPTEVTLKISFDETTGVLKVGASALGYRLARDEAKALASALVAFASR